MCVCVCVCVCVREREREVWYHLGKNKIMLGEKYLSLEIIHNGLFCLFISLFLPFSFFLPFLFLSHLSVPCVCVCVCVCVCSLLLGLHMCHFVGSQVRGQC